MTTAPEPPASRSTKLLYQPVGWVCSLVAGEIAGLAFRRVWKRVSHGDADKAPSALQLEYPMREIVLAAVLQGAISGGVRALVNRGGARAFQRWTGEWPGD